MNNLKARRTRLGSLLAVALGAAAIFVLPGLASAKHDSSSDDGTSSATIKSFDQATQTLVIALPGGETVSGTVNRRTRIRCENQSGHRGRGRDDSRVRAREAEPGDDRGGRGNEPGDDNGGDRDDDSDGDNSGRSDESHDDNGSGANCTTADLVAGAAVEEIELDFGRTSAHFDEVELDD